MKYFDCYKCFFMFKFSESENNLKDKVMVF